MNVNHLVEMAADACYGFLTINFLWGLYCVIMLWRRVGSFRFRTDQAQREFLATLQGRLEGRDFDGATHLCEEDRRALPKLVAAILGNRSLGLEQLRQMAAELMHRDVMARLEHRLSWIATVIKSGPLLGLFGTVLGMMAAFAHIGTGVKVQPSQIAKEISVALICTAMGLATAIPFSYFLATLAIRVRVLQESLSFGLSWFLDQYQRIEEKTKWS